MAENLTRSELAESWYDLLRLINPMVMDSISYENCRFWFDTAKKSWILLTVEQKAAIKDELRKINNDSNMLVSTEDILYYPSKNEYVIMYNFTRDRLEIKGEVIEKVILKGMLGKDTLSNLAYLCMWMDIQNFDGEVFKYYRNKFGSVRKGSLEPSKYTMNKIKNQVAGFFKKYRLEVDLGNIN